MDKIVDKLMKDGILADVIAKSSKTVRGIGRLDSNSLFRRVDLLITPVDELGAAMIYFTGNDF